MTFTENLDHSPNAVTLERLPDGTAWLYLRKDIHEVAGEPMEGGEPSGRSFECTTAMCKIGADYSSETQETIAASFDDWWIFAEGWSTDSEMLPTLEERVSVLETMFMMGGL